MTVRVPPEFPPGREARLIGRALRGDGLDPEGRRRKRARLVALRDDPAADRRTRRTAAAVLARDDARRRAVPGPADGDATSDTGPIGSSLKIPDGSPDPATRLNQ